MNGLDDTQMVLRHGVAGRSPLGPAVRLAVQAICRAGRRNLPRPLWLRGCDLFVQFMAGVTQYKPLAAGACPHRVVLPDGTEVHTVNACPRCCVFGHVFETLREEIKAAVAVRPYLFPQRVPPREVAQTAVCTAPSAGTPLC